MIEAGGGSPIRGQQWLIFLGLGRSAVVGDSLAEAAVCRKIFSITKVHEHTAYGIRQMRREAGATSDGLSRSW